MMSLSRWLAPAVLAAGLGFGAMIPAPAQAQDDLVRVLVDVADVVIRGGYPYYRYGDYGYDDRLLVRYDRYGRPLYYRNVYRAHPLYGNGYGYYNQRDVRKVKCNPSGKCRVEYYDPRFDRSARYSRFDDHDDWDRHRGRGRRHHDDWDHHGHDDD